MVLDRRAIERRLAELDTILAELAGLDATDDDLADDLARRWSVERGLLAAANLVFDIANHIGAGHFARHPGTYEDGLRQLTAKKVIADETYAGLQGLGGFRNVLAHEYLEIDLDEVVRWNARIEDGVPRFIAQVQSWLDTVA